RVDRARAKHRKFHGSAPCAPAAATNLLHCKHIAHLTTSTQGDPCVKMLTDRAMEAVRGVPLSRAQHRPSLLRTDNHFPVVFGSRRTDATYHSLLPRPPSSERPGLLLGFFNMTRSHRTKRNDGKPSPGRNGAALDGRSAKSKTVMIVEDNELNMKLFHDLLEAYGYYPIGTRNGIEALDLARKHRPDLILMDIQLPEVSGLEVTKWLKEDAEVQAIPVVAGTAFAVGGDEERMREAGWGAYVWKPIPVPQFIETIRHF